ncbi:cobalamin-dependent protein [Trinickia dinghuensis]|uniref:B12-binding domain-containing protein n=1 Tax=Trinickia dinghuensis TaxID=2291023 RepID=A0A3D8JNF8_9BURK|nr:cobalamin-dependent protein [Trinickia dinghuensis]RDU94557.1 hypothetical protein DWV00_33280 [Trinickia dinghuensis]
MGITVKSGHGGVAPANSFEPARLVIGMTESDCHTVSIYLFKLFLEEHGIAVLNLGACVSLDRMFSAARDYTAQAIVFGAQNGHAYDDLIGLRQCRERYALACPVFLGGNLTVGAEKDRDIDEIFREIGVDYLVSDFESFLSIFQYLNVTRSAVACEAATDLPASLGTVAGATAASSHLARYARH